jgi:hypothetical protein
MISPEWECQICRLSCMGMSYEIVHEDGHTRRVHSECRKKSQQVTVPSGSKFESTTATLRA